MSEHIYMALATHLVRQHEGLGLVVYDDATGRQIGPGDTLQGHPTIGYGRALDVNGISHAEAEELLLHDLHAACRVAEEFAGEPTWARLCQARRAALIDMAHNLGRSGLLGFKLMRLAIRAGDFDHTADEMLDSRWSRQVGRRAQRLATIMRTGLV